MTVKNMPLILKFFALHLTPISPTPSLLPSIQKYIWVKAKQ